MTIEVVDRRARKRATDKAYRQRHPDRIAAYGRAWHAANRERVAAYRITRRELTSAQGRSRNLLRHGLSLEGYNGLLERQGGGCAICGAPETTYPDGRIRRLDVDHNHACCPGPSSCGSCIRGLLCSNCNRGSFGFDPARLRVAADYFGGAL